jgi:hypothetical protein
MLGLFRGLSIIFILSAFVSLPAQAADLSSLQPTASDEGVAGLVRLECGYDPFPSCSVLVQELIQGKTETASVVGLKKVAQEIAAGIYEGKLYPNGRRDATGASRESEPFGVPPICSAVPVVLSGSGCKEELQKNHLEQDCGKPFIVKWSSSPPGYYSNIRKSNGSRETAHFAGIYLAALSHSYKKIESEILSNRLSIPSGACSSQAADLKDLIKKHKSMTNMGKLSSCDPKNLDECSAMKYFRTGQESIRSAYLMLARCRMIDESSRDQRQFVNTARSGIESQAMQPCAQSCGNNDSCITSCYQNKYKQWIENEVRTKFSKAAESC